MFATGHSDAKCIKELTAAGADINKQGTNGQIALIFAAGHGHVKCIKELIAAGADINKQGTNDQTALMIAADQGHVECLKALISAGADINKADKDGGTALMIAAEKGHVECLKELIAVGADINKKDNNGRTALIHAAHPGYFLCLKELTTTANTDVNIQAEDGHTAFSLSIINRNVHCIKELIAAGASKIIANGEALQHFTTGSIEFVTKILDTGIDVNSTDENGNTALMTAVRNNNKEIVQLLIARGAKVNAENDKGQTALYLAVVQSHLEFERQQRKEENERLWSIVQILLLAGSHLHETKSGLNPNTVHLQLEKLSKPNPQILTMLHAAGNEPSVDRRFLTSTKSLQEYARDNIRKILKENYPEENLYSTVLQLELPSKLKSYLLYHALRRGNGILNKDEKNLLLKTSEGEVENVQHLIDTDVDLNVQDDNGMTALMIASQNGTVQLVEQLVEGGVDLNIQGLFGDTALIHATRSQKHESVKKLLEHGANINIQGKDGNTALIYAAKELREDILCTLLDAGANPNITNDDGRTALIVGARSLKCVQMLIEAGADVNTMDKDGQTALTRAVTSREVDCVNKLIASGAEINGGTNGTALMEAASKGHVECLNVLIREGADLNMKDKSGFTATTMAALFGSATCFSTLLGAGGEVNILLDLIVPREIKEDFVAEPLRKKLTDQLTDVIQEQNREYFFSQMSKAMAPEYLRRNLTSERLIPWFFQLSKVNVETQQSALKMFFEVGGIPDNADNYRDFKVLTAALEGFGWMSPLKLATLCRQKSSEEMLDVLPVHGGSPMTTTRKGRRYLATVAKGEATSLQGDKSDVKLEIKKGCPKRAYLMEVRTDISSFESIIPDDECFISPIVEVLSPAETNTSEYVLRIPHCLDEEDDRTKVKVRMIHENRNPAVVEVPKGNAGALYYDIDAGFIELHTTHFCQVICTICQTPYHCLQRINTLWFARFDIENAQNVSQPEIQIFLHDVEIRPYFGGALHSIMDFRKNITEATVNMAYVTHQALKTTTTNIIPNTGRVKVSLEVKDERWQDELEQWDKQSRTFTKEKDLLDVIGPGNVHRCSGDPIEAGSYCLQAAGPMIERFRGNAKAELNVDIEDESSEDQQKPELSVVELPVDFSKYDLDKQLESESAPENKCQRIHLDIDAMFGTEGFQKPPTGSCRTALQHQSHSQLDLDSGFNAVALPGDVEPLQQIKNLQDIKEEIDEIVETAGFDQLPSRVSESEIVRLAPLFSESTLKRVAIRYFEFTLAHLKDLRVDAQDAEQFNRELLISMGYKVPERKNFYRTLLIAEYDRMLDDVNMAKVEKLILYPERREARRLLEVENPPWQSKQEIDKWNVRSRTFESSRLYPTETEYSSPGHWVTKKMDSPKLFREFKQDMKRTVEHMDFDEAQMSVLTKPSSQFKGPQASVEPEHHDTSCVGQGGVHMHGLESQYPPKLSLLCQQKPHVDEYTLKVMTSKSSQRTLCPMTTTRKGRRYLATVARGEATSLQGDKSDVKLEIKEGCPKSAYLMEVRTDLSNFGSIIPDDECFISPIVEVLGPAETSTSSYTLRIPHCLDDNDDKTKVKVRIIHENKSPAMVEVPKRVENTKTALCYDIDCSFIELCIPHFCKIICTTCQKPFHCLNIVNVLFFAKFETHTFKKYKFKIFTKNESQHNVEIRPYFCCIIHNLEDFMEHQKQLMEETTRLRYITCGNLAIPKGNFNAEFGPIIFSLQLHDKAWQPRLRVEEWDATHRIFTMRRNFTDVAIVENGHICRGPPFEATIYSLMAKGKVWELFRSTFKAKFSSKTKLAPLQIPVDFTREDVARSPPQTAPRYRICQEPEQRYGPGSAMPSSQSTLNPKDINEEINEKVEAAGFDKLPSRISNSEIVRLASLFSECTLKKVAMGYFGFTPVKLRNLRADNISDAEQFNIELLILINNKCPKRKNFYRTLLMAEYDRILVDVNMARVEKLILEPEPK